MVEQIVTDSGHTEFAKELGLKEAVSIAVGAMIGGGIFSVLGRLAGIAGPSAILSFLLGGIIAFLTATAQLAHAQLARRIDEDSSAYQGLVRKNLDLRKELRGLEKKYASLENERKVLILHVKDLQTTRGATEAMIQDLKGKIASLRIEMLKDPKMAKTLDFLNRKIIHRPGPGGKDGP